MNEIQKYSALKLPWEQVSRYVGSMVSAILEQDITCSTKGEDDNYWSVEAEDYRFTNVEIVRLVKAVDGSEHMLSHALPIDSNTSKSLEMELCRALLQRALDLAWDTEFVAEDALWVADQFPEDAMIPEPNRNLLYVDSKVIDCRELMPMKEFVEKLYDDGGTFTDLTNLCEAYEFQYGTPLYWLHPFTDGKYNGCYFVLVQEGVLILSYDEIDGCDHEVFIRDSARLCDAEEMRCFLTEWNIRSTVLTGTLSSLLNFLRRKEAGVHGK